LALVTTIRQMLSIADAMERGAAKRYETLGGCMRRVGHLDLARVFDALALEERHHVDSVAHLQKAAHTATSEADLAGFSLPETFGVEDAASAALLTPYKALSIAVRCEEEAFTFWTYVASETTDAGVRVQAEAMARLPDGEVLVVGRDCDQSDRLAVERWAPGRADSTVIPLPAWDGKLLRAMVLATERDRYVVARFEAASTLARIDVAEAGATAVPLSLPSNKPVTDASLATADGALWILLGEGDGIELFRRNKEGVYTRATFPKGQGLSPTGMAAASADVVYLAGTTSNVRSVILSSRPGKLSFPSDEPRAGGPDAGAPAAPDAGAASAAPAALSSSCASPFVILFAVSKSAPADYDYPATRDALSGWADGSKYRFIEYSHRGQRMLGASAPDAARAEALAARLRERVKGASPAVACFTPAEVLREVRLAGAP